MIRARTNRLFFINILALMVLTMMAFNAIASEPIGKVTTLEGAVDVLKGGQLPAVDLKVGDLVYEKDVVRSKANGKAEITFNDGNVVRIAPSSRVDISEYNAKEGSNKAVIKLPRGKIQSVVNKDIAKNIATTGKSTYEVRTPNAVAGVRGTDYFVFHNQNISGVAVKEGVVVAQNPKFPDVVVVVTAGQMTSIPENKPPTPPQQTSSAILDTHQKDVTPDKEKKQEDKKDEKAEGKKDDAAAQKQGADKQPEGQQQAAQQEQKEQKQEQKQEQKEQKQQVAQEQKQEEQKQAATSTSTTQTSTSSDAGATTTTSSTTTTSPTTQSTEVSASTPTASATATATTTGSQTTASATATTTTSSTTTSVTSNVPAVTTTTLLTTPIVQPVTTTTTTTMVSQQVTQQVSQQVTQQVTEQVTQVQQTTPTSTATTVPKVEVTASQPSGTVSAVGGVPIISTLSTSAATDSSGKWLAGNTPVNFSATYQGGVTPEPGSTLQTAITSTNPDGSSTYGLLVGAMHSWDGFLTMLYRDAQRNIGFLTGSLSGTTSSTGLSGAGSATVQIMGSTTDTRPLGEILKSYVHWGNLVINVGGQSSVFGNDLAPSTNNGVLLTGLGNLSIFAGTDVTGGITNRGAASGTITFHAHDVPTQPTTPIYDRYYGVARLQQGSLTNTAFDANYVGHALSLTDYYTLIGKVVGTPSADGTLKYAYAGQQIATPLTFASHFMGGHLYGPNIPYLDLFAQFGGTGNLWSTAGSSFTLIGDVHYFVYAQTPNQTLPSYNRYAWDLHFSSQNAKAQTHTTYDGGAYMGMMAGAVDTAKTTGFLTGSTYALYIDPSGNAGILKGTVAGSSLYDRLTWVDTYGPGYWQPFDAVGSFQPVQFVSNTGIVANNLPVGWMFDSNYVKQNAAYYSSSPNTKIKAYAIDSLGYPSSNAYNLTGGMGSYNFTSQPTFGIWTVPTYFTQIPWSSNRLLLTTDFSQSNSVASTAAIVNQTALGFVGYAYGYWGDYESGTTYVMSGNTHAMNDTAYGFTSNTVGTWLSTQRFLNMLNSEPTKLTSLGYPITSTGSVGSLQTQGLAVNDIRFYGDAAADLVGFWTGQSVSGSILTGMMQTFPHSQIMTNADGSLIVYNNFKTAPSLSQSNTSSKWLSEVWGFGATTIGGSTKLIGIEGAAAGTASLASNTITITGNAAGLYHYINYISKISDDSLLTYLLSYNYKSIDNYAYEASGYFKGLLADDGMRSIWLTSKDAPASFEMIGNYIPGLGLPMPPSSTEPYIPQSLAQNHVFGTVIYPNNFTNTTSKYSTVDGGSYWGYLTGIQKTYPDIAGNLEGIVSSVYISPSRTAGIILGGFGYSQEKTGYFDFSSGVWTAEGTMYPVVLSTTTLQASSLYSSIKSAVFDFAGYNGTFSTSGGINTPAQYTTIFNWIDSPTTKDFGVWSSGFYGTYSGDYSGTWSIDLKGNAADKGYQMGTMAYGVANSWSNDVIHGSQRGFFADTGSRAVGSPSSQITGPMTGITVGEVIGTFNPSNVTYQTVSSGVWMETNKLLQMASTADGRTKLQDLKIPAFEVGRATLTGSGNGFSNLTMSDVVFLAPTSGGRPAVWATGIVTGQYTTAPTLNQAINLTSGSVNANFTFKQWNEGNNTWLSSINGTGTVGSHTNVILNGAGAGSINQTTKTISGTAAGIAK